MQCEKISGSLQRQDLRSGVPVRSCGISKMDQKIGALHCTQCAIGHLPLRPVCNLRAMHSLNAFPYMTFRGAIARRFTSITSLRHKLPQGLYYRVYIKDDIVTGCISR